MTDSKEVKTQEIWVSNYYIDQSKGSALTKINIPTCCPHCNSDIVAVPGNSAVSGYLTKTCSHLREWEDIVKESKNLEAKVNPGPQQPAQAPAVNGQKFWINKANLNSNMGWGDGCEQITIPHNCPDCNAKITISTKYPGNELYSSALEKESCSHIKGYEQIAAIRLDKLDKPKEISIDTETAPLTTKEEEKVSFPSYDAVKDVKTMDMDKLNPGDRILVKVVDSDEIEYEVPGVVVGKTGYGEEGDNLKPEERTNLIIRFDEYLETETGYESFSCPADLRQVAKNMGLDPHANYFWDMTDGGCTSTVLKKLPRSKNSDNKDSKKEKDVKMPYNENGEEMTFFEMVKTEAAEAGLQIAATQLTDGLQQGLLLLLKDKGEFNDGELAVVKKLLASKGGHAALSWLLGFALLKLDVPGFTDLPGVEDLAKNFRVGGMRELGNEGADIAKQYFMPAIMNAMSLLPKVAENASTLAASKKRVAELGNSRVANLELVQDEEEEVDVSEMDQAVSR